MVLNLLHLYLHPGGHREELVRDRKSTRLNSSHQIISYAVFCLKKKKQLHPCQSEDAPWIASRPRCGRSDGVRRATKDKHRHTLASTTQSALIRARQQSHTIRAA